MNQMIRIYRSEPDINLHKEFLIKDHKNLDIGPEELRISRLSLSREGSRNFWKLVEDSRADFAKILKESEDLIPEEDIEKFGEGSVKVTIPEEFLEGDSN